MSKIVPVSAILDFDVKYAEFCKISGVDSLLLYYPMSTLSSLSLKDRSSVIKNRIEDEGRLPSRLSCAAVQKAIGSKEELGLFILGNKSVKNNQSTYLSIAESWLRFVNPSADFSTLRSDITKYNKELSDLVSKGLQFKTHVKNWYFGWRVGPSGDAQDIKFS